MMVLVFVFMICRKSIFKKVQNVSVFSCYEIDYALNHHCTNDFKMMGLFLDVAFMISNSIINKLCCILGYILSKVLH